MTERLSIHQPLLVEDPSPKSVDERRVYDLLVAQENIARIVDEFADKPWLDGVLIEDIVLSSSSVNLVNHKLGKTIRNWFVAKKNANADIWEDETVTVDSTIQLALQVSLDVTISLVVI